MLSHIFRERRRRQKGWWAVALLVESIGPRAFPSLRRAALLRSALSVP